MLDTETEAEAEGELTDEQKEMLSVMGFSDFVSTKVRAIRLFNQICYRVPTDLESKGT